MIKMVTNPKIMYKFGQTTCDDVAERFTAEYAERCGFRTNCVLLSRDYKIRVLWSAYVTQEQADVAEWEFEARHPKNVLTVARYNGISECRYFKYDESKAIADYLRETYPQQTKKPGMVKIYWVMATKIQAVALQLPFEPAQ